MSMLVTGFTSDISQSIMASALSEKKRVLFTSTNAQSLKEGEAKYPGSKGFLFDFSKSDLYEQYWDQFSEETTIQELVLCAHQRVSSLKRFHEQPFDNFASHITSNVVGMSFLLHKILSGMCKQRYGRVVLISSISTEQGTSRYPSYIAAKSALEGLMRNLAVDYGHDNIHFNTIRLGIMETSRNGRVIHRSSYKEKMEKVIPLGRYGKPEDVLPFLKAYLSENSYATGTAVNVGGGFPLICSEGMLT